METNTKLAVVAVAITVIAVAAVLIATWRINNTGRIITVGVSASINTIDWGDISPNETKVVTFIVTNTGSTIGNLTMTTEGMPTDLLISWDANGRVLQANQSTTVTVQLTAKPAATAQNFTFNIIITLTKQVAGTTA